MSNILQHSHLLTNRDSPQTGFVNSQVVNGQGVSLALTMKGTLAAKGT